MRNDHKKWIVARILMGYRKYRLKKYSSALLKAEKLNTDDLDHLIKEHIKCPLGYVMLVNRQGHVIAVNTRTEDVKLITYFSDGELEKFNDHTNSCAFWHPEIKSTLGLFRKCGWKYL